MAQTESVDILEMVEPWAVLAVSVLITTSASRSFGVIDLLKAPIKAVGKIEGAVAVAALPQWFPAEEAYFEAQGGVIFSRVKDLALPNQRQKLPDGSYQLHFDVSRVGLPAAVSSFTLTYFPWFRFLSEPISFDAEGKVAHYIADAVRFLFTREGVDARVENSGDTCRVVTDAGFTVEVTGMASLRQLRIAIAGGESIFDIDARRIQIDRRMFPAAYQAGHEMLRTSDRLMNITVTDRDPHLTLAYDGDMVRV
jgi:hypothetical protein